MKPTIYRITHLWPNKQPGHGLTAQIEEDRIPMIAALRASAKVRDGRWIRGAPSHVLAEFLTALEDDGWLLIPAADKRDSTVQIKAETDELNALPSRFVSLQDYERLEREARR